MDWQHQRKEMRASACFSMTFDPYHSNSVKVPLQYYFRSYVLCMTSLPLLTLCRNWRLRLKTCQPPAPWVQSCSTDHLKLSLTQECCAWTLWRWAEQPGLSQHTLLCGQLDQEAPEAYRWPGGCFWEVRKAEIRIDATIGPVEESFALLNRHELIFSDGNAEKVDGLTYAWRNLNALVGGKWNLSCISHVTFSHLTFYCSSIHLSCVECGFWCQTFSWFLHGLSFIL